MGQFALKENALTRPTSASASSQVHELVIGTVTLLEESR
jgi:hypothetical protein